jgi:hypothetical protein
MKTGERLSQMSRQSLGLFADCCFPDEFVHQCVSFVINVSTQPISYRVTILTDTIHLQQGSSVDGTELASLPLVRQRRARLASQQRIDLPCMGRPWANLAATKSLQSPIIGTATEALTALDLPFVAPNTGRVLALSLVCERSRIHVHDIHFQQTHGENLYLQREW